MAAEDTVIRLQSNDNAVIEVSKCCRPLPLPAQPSDHRNADRSAEKKVAERSLLIKNMLEDLGDAAISQTIPIPNVSAVLRSPNSAASFNQCPYLPPCSV
jgi:hypothetical protein